MSNTRSSESSTEIRRPLRLDREGEAMAKTPGAWRNVGGAERLLGGTAGAAMVALAMGRGGILGRILMTACGGFLLYRSVTGRCPIYSAFNLSTAQRHPAHPEDYFQRGIHVETSHVINAAPERLYRFWRDFTNLPRIMRHVKSVQTLSNFRSRWTVDGPMNTSIFWEAEIIHDVPNELIAWSSVEHSDVENAGTVIFTPRQDDQTEVRVVLDYIPPAGKLGKAIAQLFGQTPEKTIADDLCRFKLLMEACDPAI